MAQGGKACVSEGVKIFRVGGDGGRDFKTEKKKRSRNLKNRPSWAKNVHFCFAKSGKTDQR